ncbi:protein jim lovell [Diachasmimorpha longicaudata]|uniref:protein jim lovell n=1 Tax=Diachasmimorpha longicaudata TaxID=58733 RepID=UPI0030B8A196
MSSTAESPDGGMALQSHYSLRWNNHQTHILQAFEALLHAEILVDVTLVCSDSSIRAHKVVLSACSPFFERIFAEHPCKHPVIVLKDFPGREVAALIDFMYRGEVRVGREELPGLMRAAESLQVRGLASSEPRPASPPVTPVETPIDLLGDRLSPEGDHDADTDSIQRESRTIFSRDRDRDRLPHMGHLNFSLRELRESCNSPLLPRRKQARPRRRSGELIPQDLSRPHPPASLSPPCGLNLSGALPSQPTGSQTPGQSQIPSSQAPRTPSQSNPPSTPTHREETAENLSMKRSLSPGLPTEQAIKTESEAASSPRGSPMTGTSLHPDGSLQDLPTPGLPSMSLSLTPPHHPSEYLTSLGQFAAQWLPNHQSQLAHRDGSPQGHNRNPHYHQEQMTPTRRSVAVFPMDGVSPLASGGLFPHGGGLERGTLLTELHDSFKPEAFQGLFGGNLGHHITKKPKKHRGDGDTARRWSEHGRGMPIGRPKGQHSAPRGGPPRSWTNAELTEALQHVWNKKMTTSQASRMFGIPYNSLLMYVRGKYGKSLKLEQLKRDCTGATTGEVMNSLNNNVKAIQPPSQMGHPLGLPHPGDESYSHHPLLGGNLPQGFFPDFGAAFPVPVSMVHLLPPSEQKAFEGVGGSGGGGNSDLGQQSRSPSPSQHDSIQPPQSAPALLQQNGSE